MPLPGVRVAAGGLLLMGAFSGVIRAGAIEAGEKMGVYPDDGRDFWQNSGYYTAQHAIGIYEGVLQALGQKADGYINGSHIHLAPDANGVLQLAAIEKDGVVEVVEEASTPNNAQVLVLPTETLMASINGRGQQFTSEPKV